MSETNETLDDHMVTFRLGEYRLQQLIEILKYAHVKHAGKCFYDSYMGTIADELIVELKRQREAEL